ncbi:hypothetical protein [Pararhizobium sp. DWP1-1-3]|uniref:hypothetical protein n=1 Tax=Pararhizobium sp. DWP1-1-3 TaxID=2804652 RepID=UPI003CF616F3
MPTIKEVRAQYPQYDDMSDQQLADALHTKFYSDMPRADFNAKIGMGQQSPQRSGQHLSFEDGAALVDREERMSGVNGATGAALTGILDGVPIAGPVLLGTAQRGAAGLSSLINGEDYATNLKEAQALTETAQEQHPNVTMGANLVGAVGGTLPMIAAAPAAFGGGAGNLFMRSLAAAGSGSAVGGADQAVRSGGNPDAVIDGMKWGGGTGLFGPVTGKVVGAGARAAMDRLKLGRVAKAAGTKASTVAKLAKAIMGDGMDETAMRARLDTLGPNGMIADLGPNLQGQAGALASMPGRAQEIMRSALDTRNTGANARIGAAVDDSMGRNVIPSEVQGNIAANQRAVGPAYGQAFENAPRYDMTPIADDIDLSVSRLRGPAQTALRRVRGMLNIEGTEQLSADPSVMFQTRQAIDGMLTGEVDPKVINALSEVRQQLDDGLIRAVPRIKEADASYAELARQNDALTRGQTVLDHGRTAPRPAELAQEFEHGALPQGRQIGPSAAPLRLRQGARAEVDRILGSNANDVAKLNNLIKSEGDWNRDRLATLFGQDRADRLFQVLDNERTFAGTRQSVMMNSETARRQAHRAELGGEGDPNFTRNAFAAGGLSGTARATGVKAADKIMNMIVGSRREAANASLAEAMVTNRAAMVDALAKAQRSGGNPALVEALTKSILLGGGTARAR